MKRAGDYRISGKVSDIVQLRWDLGVSIVETVTASNGRLFQVRITLNRKTYCLIRMSNLSLVGVNGCPCKFEVP